MNVIRLNEPFVYLSPGTYTTHMTSCWDASPSYICSANQKGRKKLDLRMAAGQDMWGLNEEILTDLACILLKDSADYLYVWVQTTDKSFVWGVIGTDRPVLTDPCRELTDLRNYGGIPVEMWLGNQTLTSIYSVSLGEVEPVVPVGLLCALFEGAGV